MKICGTFRRDHGFSSFIDDQIVPHHALGKIAVKGCDLGCQRANHSRAIRGAAVPCWKCPGVNSFLSIFDGAPPPRITRRGGSRGSPGAREAPGGPACPVAVYEERSRWKCRRTVHNVPILRTLCTFLVVFVHNVPVFRTLYTLVRPPSTLLLSPAPLAV